MADKNFSFEFFADTYQKEWTQKTLAASSDILDSDREDLIKEWLRSNPPDTESRDSIAIAYRFSAEDHPKMIVVDPTEPDVAEWHLLSSRADTERHIGMPAESKKNVMRSVRTMESSIPGLPVSYSSVSYLQIEEVWSAGAGLVVLPIDNKIELKVYEMYEIPDRMLLTDGEAVTMQNRSDSDREEHMLMWIDTGSPLSNLRSLNSKISESEISSEIAECEKEASAAAKSERFEYLGVYAPE